MSMLFITGPGKGRLYEHLAGNNRVSITTLAHLAHSLGASSDSASTITHQLREDLEKLHTPHGYLIQTVDLPLTNGTMFKWKVCNPYALLFYLCTLSTSFGDFMVEHVGDSVCGIGLYTDETSPGNVIAPGGPPRKTQTVYWTCMRWPHWFRVRQCGWLPFGYLQHKVQKLVKGGLSGLVLQQLQFSGCLYKGQVYWCTYKQVHVLNCSNV